MGLAREGRLARTWAGVEGEVANKSQLIVSFLEAAVNVTAEVRKLEGAVGEIRERRR
jgi:hypothetical protein